MARHLSRAVLANPIRFELAAVHNAACRAVVRTMRRGIKGQIPREQVASVALGLKAALAILDRTAPVASSPLIPAGTRGTMLVTWAPPALSSGPPAPSGSSTRPSNGSTYSFVTEDSARRCLP